MATKKKKNATKEVASNGKVSDEEIARRTAKAEPLYPEAFIQDLENKLEDARQSWLYQNQPAHIEEAMELRDDMQMSLFRRTDGGGMDVYGNEIDAMSVPRALQLLDKLGYDVALAQDQYPDIPKSLPKGKSK